MQAAIAIPLRTDFDLQMSQNCASRMHGVSKPAINMTPTRQNRQRDRCGVDTSIEQDASRRTVAISSRLLEALGASRPDSSTESQRSSELESQLSPCFAP